MDGSKVFGIDLGTTYSCIAYVDEYGVAVVVNNMESQPTTPSVVLFNPDGTYTAGQMAKNQAGVYPERVVSLVKREMGHPEWRFSVDDQEFSAPQVSSKILEALVEDARLATGEDVKEVVVTVPAYFGQGERDATRNAGTIAGLTVIDVIPEPTAAAFTYGFGKGAGRDETVLVYDLGGGTFDVTVMRLTGGNITVIATDGDPELGGADWDKLLIDLLLRKFMDAHPDSDDPAFDPYALAELQQSAETAKRSLSASPSTKVRVQFEAHMDMIEVTREEFEAATSDLLAQTLTLTRAVMKAAAGKGVGSLDRLLLVGGSSIMPAVQAMLKQEIGLEPEVTDPHMAVAKGAALWGQKADITAQIINQLAEDGIEVADGDLSKIDAEVITDMARKLNIGMRPEALTDIVTTQASNVCSQGFGLKVIDDSRREYVDFLLHRNDPLPSSPSEVYGTDVDDQPYLQIVLYEQQTPTESSLLEDNKELVSGTVGPLPPGYPRGTDVFVSFDMDNSGLLRVTARHAGVNEPLVLVQQTEGALMTETEVREAREQMAGIVRQ